jgi:hypothetical protein
MGKLAIRAGHASEKQGNFFRRIDSNEMTPEGKLEEM